MSTTEQKPSNAVFLILTVILFSGLYWAFSDGDDPETKTEIKKDLNRDMDRMLAYNIVSDNVEKLLKSPSTAEFPGLFEKSKHITLMENDTILIISWVDSQNGFGAIVRTRFSAKALVSGSSVRAFDLNVY